MENLTERQVELIEDLLMTYEKFAKFAIFAGIHKSEIKKFVFNAKDYYIWKKDYKRVCEIIDYIKGVKK